MTPFGTGHASFCDALLGARSAIAPIQGFDTTDCRSRLGAAIVGFDPSPWVAPMKMRRMDRTAVYAVAATRLAIEDAGRSIPPDGDDRTGVVLGTWTAGGGSTQIFLDALFRQGVGCRAGAPVRQHGGEFRREHRRSRSRLRGPNMTVSHKEASGLAAIVDAVDILREGHASSLIAGGTDAVFETFFKAHDRFGVMSPSESFSSKLAPFDAEREGFVLGEGAVSFWLERSDAAPEPRPWRNSGSGGVERIGPVECLAGSSRAARADDEAGDGGRRARACGHRRRLRVGERDTRARSLRGAGSHVALRRHADGGDRRSRARSANPAPPAALACAAACLCGPRVPPVAGLSEPDRVAASLRLACGTIDAPGPIVLVNSFASGGALFSAVLRIER